MTKEYFINNLLNVLARNNYWEEIRDMFLEIPDIRLVLEKAENMEVFDCDEEENEEEDKRMTKSIV